jgi:hypothetical protein
LANSTVTPLVVTIEDEAATLTRVSRVVLDALDRQARRGEDKFGGELGVNQDGTPRDLHRTGALFNTAEATATGVRFTVDYAHVLSKYDADDLSAESQAEVERELTPLLRDKVVAR